MMIFSQRLMLERRKFTNTASAIIEICTRVIAEISSTPRIITFNIPPIANIKKGNFQSAINSNIP